MIIVKYDWHDGEVEWVFAEDIEDSNSFYVNHGQFTIEDVNLCCNVSEIPYEKWKDCYIIDPNEYDPDKEDDADRSNGYLIVESFAQYADRNNETDLICTTDY